MPDSARQTQLALIDSLARARRLAMSIVLPVVCLLSIVTIVLTNDGLSHHAYNTPIYSIIVVWFLLSWCGVRLYPGSELSYVSMLLAYSFFLVSKLTALILFADGINFSLGLMEGMIWLYAVIVFALINSTLIFHWHYSPGLMPVLSLISLFYALSNLDSANATSNLVALTQLNSVGWIILTGSKGYMLRKEMHTVHVNRMTTLERIAHTDILTGPRNRCYLSHYLQDSLGNPSSNILSAFY